MRTVQVAGQLQHALLAARRGHDLDAGSQTEEYGQGVDVLRLQARSLASGGFLEGGQDLVRLNLRRARVPPGTWAGFGWAELLNDLGCAGAGNQG